MIEIKKYIANQMIGKKLHFKCDCVISMDFVGVVKDYEISSREIILLVETDGRIIRIGENHPNMKVELV